MLVTPKLVYSLLIHIQQIGKMTFIRVYVLNIIITMATAAILKCSDYKGDLFRNGHEYVPNKKEPCNTCICDRGFPGKCRQLPCAPPPKHCRHIAHAEGCCKYLCLDKFLRNPTKPVGKGNCTDVAIIGAGVSGAYAAWLLRSRNLTIDVYEYSNRVGGRLHTVTLPKIPDVNIELGGMRFVPEWHPKFYKLVNALRLEVVDFKNRNSSRETLYYLRGRQLREKDFTSSRLPYHLRDVERGKSPSALRWQLFTENTNYTDIGPRQFRISRDLLEIATKDGLLLHDQSYDTVIGGTGSSEAYHYIRDTEGYASFFGHTSAAIHIPLAGPRSWNKVPNYKTLKKGMDHLPKTLLKEALAGQSYRLHLNHRLTKIQTLSSRRYQLIFKETVTKKDGYTRDAYGKKTFVKTCAKKVILALPRLALAGITWRGSKKHRLFKRYLSSVDDTPAVKIYLGFRNPWWEKFKVKFSHIITDLPLQNVFFGQVSSQTEHATLLAVYKDVDVSYWKQLTRLGKSIRGSLKTPYTVTKQVVTHIKRHLADILGLKVGQIPNPISGAMYIWENYPFGGAYNMWLPGYDWDGVRKIMTRPAQHEHVYTVGSAFSFHDNQAWVEGALERTEELIQDYF